MPEKRPLVYFCVVILLGAPSKARGQTHFHFRIDAAGIRGIAPNLDLAAANLEQVQKSGRKQFGRAPGRKWAIVKTARADPVA